MNKRGISLITLVITIIILLILVGVTINYMLSKDGIITKAIEAREEHNKTQAKEKLNTVLLEAQIEKTIDKKYNKYEYLNKYIKDKIPDCQIKEDIVIVDGYAFEINREVPCIGRYVGKEDELVFPELTLEKELAEDKRNATITITAIENVNGINKIEVIQDDYVIHTYTYDNVKEEIVEKYVAKQNGTYIVKVYANLTAYKNIEIDGIVEYIKFVPNGSTEYAKSHSTKLQMPDDSNERIVEMKYQWLDTPEEPAADTFVESISFDEVVTKDGVDESWYLWVMFKTESGATNICRSEAFLFDNKGPTATLNSVAESETSFILNATGNDTHVDIAKYEFYIDDKLEKTVETSENEASATIDVGEMKKDVNAYVIVTDILGNETKVTANASTMLHTWERWSANISYSYQEVELSEYNVEYGYFEYVWYLNKTGIEKDLTIGKYRITNYGGTTYGRASELQIGYYISPTGKYGDTSNECRKIVKIESSIQSDYIKAIVKRYEIKNVASYSKGNSKYNDVTSVYKEKYPNKNHQDGYWYIYKGIK